MKLPTDKKQRTQMLVLMGIVAAGAVYVLIQHVLLPFVHSRQDLPEQLEALNQQVSVAEAVIARVPDQIEQYNEIVALVHDADERYFIKPVLGSYILEAERMLAELAMEAGIEIAGIREAGFPASMAAIWRRRQYQIRPYSVNVNLLTDYQDLLRFVDVVEQSNPFVSVLDLEISERRNLPQAHNIRFRIQWPMWGDSGTIPQFRNGKRDAL